MADLSAEECAAARADLAEMAQALAGLLEVAQRLAARIGGAAGDFRRQAEEARALRLTLDPPSDLPGLLEAVAAEYGVTARAIRGPKRDHRILPARRAFIVAARRRGASLAAIGQAISRDHTSVMAALRQAEGRPRLRAAAQPGEGRHD